MCLLDIIQRIHNSWVTLMTGYRPPGFNCWWGRSVFLTFWLALGPTQAMNDRVRQLSLRLTATSMLYMCACVCARMCLCSRVHACVVMSYCPLCISSLHVFYEQEQLKDLFYFYLHIYLLVLGVTRGSVAIGGILVRNTRLLSNAIGVPLTILMTLKEE